MAVNKFQTLLLNMMLLVMQKKYRLDEIVIISRQMKDRIALLDCGKVQGATLDGERNRCICQNAGSILSDEHGKLKCYGKADKPNCLTEIISNGSHTYHIIDFQKECPRRTVLNSAAWNINTTGEARGYWLYSEDIRTFLNFNPEGNLKVNVSKGLLDGLLLKLDLLCSSTNMIKCVMIKIYGARLYPLTQFNISTIVPTPTTTAATETTVTTRAAAASNTAFSIKTTAIMKTTRRKAATSATTGRRLAKAKQTISPIMKPKSTATPTSRSETNTKQPISKNSTNTQTNNSIKQNSSSGNHIAIIVLLVASLTMLISSILLVYLWRQRKRKLNLRKDKRKRPSQQPLEPFNLQPAFSEAKRNSAKSNIYETFGGEYTSITIATSLTPAEQKAQYNKLPHDYQEVKSVYTDLSNISHEKPEEREKKVFRSHHNILREKASVTPKLDEGKRQYNEHVASYQGAKPIYTNISKDNPTFEEEDLYKELEEPKQKELPPASNVTNKQASVAFNPQNKSDKQLPQYSEVAPQHPDSLPVYANPNAVGVHVYRELEEPKKKDSPVSPNVIYDKPQSVVQNYCHRIRKLSSEVLNPKLIQARELSDGIVV